MVTLRLVRAAGLCFGQKQLALKQGQGLSCEVCGFDFRAVYGDRGDGFIECHHIKPLETLEPNANTHVRDLALVCSNCHRMIHRRRPWLTIEQVREIVGR
jgi:5-methylcytosine-specific restriction enzyme A